MCYFESLLRQKGYHECPLPLWKLKITEEEFEELRKRLEQRTHIINMDNPFITMCKESALFFAEFWRRLYIDGAHSIQIVYDALGSTRSSVNLADKLYDAASRGARQLGIERYVGGREDILNDMLYQGGLPMKKLVTENRVNSVWDRFARGLINRRIDFDELDLGLVAAQSQSLRDYCKQLICGIEKESYEDMPFYCKDEHDPWFLYLQELAKQERTRHCQHHPFSLSWKFRVDTVERKIYVNYIVKGSQQLPQAFLREQHLDGISSFTIQVKKNGQPIDTFEYINNFCRYTVERKRPYAASDSISIYLHDHDEPYLTGDLDMSVPHLLYRNNDGMYELGNHIGQQESLLLIPQDWKIEGASELKPREFSWNEMRLSCLIMPADFSGNIIVKGDDGNMEFSASTRFYWTEIHSHPVYMPAVVEPVYNAKVCRFMLCHDSEDDTDGQRLARVEFRSKWQNEWSDTPAYGEILARAKDANNYVTPVRLINIGEGLDIAVQHADKDSCRMKVSWSHGDVWTTEGKKEGDAWEFNKDDCRDPRVIHFNFSPNGNSRNQFELSIKAPFKDFSIVNYNGNKVEGNSLIPYSDIERYQYHLVGQDIKYTYGDIRRQLSWDGEKLYIIEGGNRLRSIPYEGSLVMLFDSREVVRSLLERTSKDIVKAEIEVNFILGDGRQYTYFIKEYPFKPCQETNRIVFNGRDSMPVTYMGALKLIKLDEPSKDIEIGYNEEVGCHILPEEIRPWGKTILIGRTKGRILPTLVDLTTDMDRAARVGNRQTAIMRIQENLQNATMGDDLWQRIIGWFERVQKDDIPASSILELYCTAQDYKSLLFLAFQLYVKRRDDGERDLLKEKLKTYSNDLAFQWYWLQPYLNGIFNQIQTFITDPKSSDVLNMYILWASHKGEKAMDYFSAIHNEEAYMANLVKCLEDILVSFTDWLKDLCVSSLTDTYGVPSQGIEKELAEKIINNPKEIYEFEDGDKGYIETNQEGTLSHETIEFFNQYAECGRTGNEAWLCKRVNAVVAHIRKETDLFAKSDEIRRSIIYCSKSSNHHFVTLLNNKLYRPL